MTDDGWDTASPARRGWTAVPVVLVLVVLGALLVRPSDPGPGGDLEVLPGRAEDGAEDGTEDHAAGDEPGEASSPGAVARVHALSTAGLTRRVPPLEVELEGRTLRSAVTSRGRQLLVLALTAPGGRGVELEVRDASTLRLVAALGRASVRAEPELLAVSPDGTAVVWLDPQQEPGQGPIVHRVGIGGGPVHRIQLPADLSVRDVRPTGGGRIAVLGTRRGETDLVVFVATGLDGAAGTGLELSELAVGDVGEGAGPGFDDGTPVRSRSAHVWDDRRQRLHVVHAQQEAVTTVDLVSGEVLGSGPDRDRDDAGVGQRTARLALDGRHIAASGTLTRPDPARGIGRDRRLPLEPLVLDVSGFDAGALRTRGAAGDLGEVLAMGRDVAAFARSVRSSPDPATTVTHVELVDLGLERSGEALVVDGDVVDAAINHAQTHLLLVRDDDAGTRVSEHPLAGGPLVERRYAPGSVVHLEAVVVIEQP